MIEIGRASARIQSGIGSLLLVLLAPLVACTSFQAHPVPVGDTISIANSANINIRDALINFASNDASRRQDLTPKAYRDMVIAIYLTAADMRYSQFRRRLAAGSRASSLLSDMGARAAVSRSTYFDRTMPAIIAVMDAERTRIRTLIMVNLRKSAEEYPLAVALSDAASYEAAASLDRAIEVLSREAANHAETANMAYLEELASDTGPPEAGVSEIMGRIRTRLLAVSRANDVATLGTMARALNLTVPADTDADGIRRLIQAHMRGIQDLAAARELARKLNVSTGE